MICCPMCNGKTIVLNSRGNASEQIRKRVCKKCGHVFYTCETDIDNDLGMTLINRYHKESNEEV